MTALSPLYRRLCLAPAAELEQVFANAASPDPEKLLGWEFYGYNTAPIASLLGIRKFKKGFYRRHGGPAPVGGYNVKIRPGSLDAPWIAGGPGAAYVGEFDVYPAGKAPGASPHPHALFFDYGRDPRNSLFDGSFLRDFLVQPDPADADVYLGKAYAALGARIPVSFFVLQRANRVTRPAAYFEAA